MNQIKFILTICISAIHIFALAQSSAEVDKGDKAFDNFDFEEAMYFYSVAQEAAPGDADITRRIANTYRRMGQTAESAEWYRKTIELDASKADDMLYYAEALKNQGQYDEAIYWYEMYNRLQPGDSRALSHLSDKFYYKDLFADTAKYSMKKLQINNPNPIIGITLFEDEKILASAVNLEKGKIAEDSPYLDVFICDFDQSKELKNPVRVDKKVNSKYHDGPVFYSFSEKKLYITRNNIKNGKPVRDKNGNVNLKVYAATYENGNWSSAQELKINDDGYSTGHACLSKDGQTMYFVSTREGGYGGSDIYQCFKAGNGWSEPINLGENINTAGNEMFPYIDERGSLYIASDGHAGLGGLDIFHSIKQNEVWQKCTNLGAPVNSAMDDFALVYDSEEDNGYFCSNRSGKGDDDLYFYKHVSIERMTVAGTIHSNNPNVTLAGERIQIKKINSGESLEQNLDEHERFEFVAEGGEKVEISLLNAEYFDQDIPVIEYSVPSVINDPFINIGSKNVDLKKIPSHHGRLGANTSATIAQIKSTNKEANSSNTETQDGTSDHGKNDMSTLDALGNRSKHDLSDDSELITRNGAFPHDQYLAKIELADNLFKEENYSQARTTYLSASAIKPSESYPKQKLDEIDRLEKNKATAAKEKQVTEILSHANKLSDKEQYQEALTEYVKAAKISPSELIKKKIAETESAIANKKAETQLSKSEIAAKKHSEFENATPFIDLVSLEISDITFDYNKALIRKEDIPALDKICQLLKENPDTKIMIRAHCDSRGSMAYNQSLSMSRAMAVQGYLIQKGIKRDRMYAEWFGEQRPLNGCIDNVPCVEGEYEVNRRAEFKIVSKK